MSIDVVDLREFYISPLGQVARHLLRGMLHKIWPSVQGETVVAVGYGTPLLRPWLGKAGRLLAMMPDAQGVAYWPREGPNLSCLTDINHLPLPDGAVDKFILLHALEAATDADALLRELWRVLKDNGRILIIVPNRRSLWAWSDRTPFGTGRPYSAFQIKDMLRDQGFLVERTWRALYVPPTQSRMILAMADKIERYARWLFPSFGGVLIMEVGKQVYAPILTKAHNFRHRVVLPLSFPVSTGREKLEPN